MGLFMPVVFVAMANPRPQANRIAVGSAWISTHIIHKSLYKTKNPSMHKHVKGAHYSEL